MKETKNHERRRRSASADVRQAIIEAAAIEFARCGYEGASTRVIAERSDVHQAQIGYHIGTKDDLWRATVDFLFARLRAELDRALPLAVDEPDADPVATFAEIIRLHVRHTSRHPELSRIMLIESPHKSDRVNYLLKNHVKPTLAALDMVWADVISAGRGNNKTAEEVFMFMIGLSPIPFAQAGIMRPLLGAARCTPEAHADSMIKWVLG